jgi:hypothetical protein
MLKADATFKGVSIQFENKSKHISLNLKIQNPK